MRFSPPVRILAAAGVLVLALVGLVVREGLAREAGQEVRLALAGYDPRSLLQGHYVQFRLSERLPPGAPCPPGADELRWPPQQGGWVALRRVGDHHTPSGAAKTQAEALKLGEVAVRGGLHCISSTSRVEPPGPPLRSEQTVAVTMDLGVDRLHLDQAQAQEMEAVLRRALPRGEAPGYAVISVGRDGKARMKGLIVGGKRTELTWF